MAFVYKTKSCELSISLLTPPLTVKFRLIIKDTVTKHNEYQKWTNKIEKFSAQVLPCPFKVQCKIKLYRK